MHRREDGYAGREHEKALLRQDIPVSKAYSENTGI